MIMLIYISNYYCPKCRKTVASEEVTELPRVGKGLPKHKTCNSEVEWKRQPMHSLDECEEYIDG